MTADRYVAEIIEVDHGVKLAPLADSVTPDQPTEVNLLAMAVALALGRAGYRHHATPRDVGLQTLDAFLAGDTTIPWQPEDASGPPAYVVCLLTAGHPTCEVRPTTD